MRKRQAALVIILLLSGSLVFVYRFQLMNGIQQRLIKSLSSQATVANHLFLQDSSFSRHLLYKLRGTDRLWPHRVNSLQRFRYLYSEFAGFECDIQFVETSGAFIVGHDEPGPDSFSDYLEADRAGCKLFWLDLKNVDSGNVASFCAQLQLLDQKFGIRDRIIVECYDPTTTLHFGEHGWLAALNVSETLGPETKGGASAINALRGLSLQKIKLLSGESGIHTAIRSEFPGSKQLSWDIRFWDGMDRGNLLRQANDTDLLVCLINVKSPGYR
jgi:hypothetical protein